MTTFNFYFPDNQDFVDPKFNGIDNSGTKHRRRYDDDHYPHEILKELPYDGMLVSMAGVGTMQKKGKYYSQELTEDFYYYGAKTFLRLNQERFRNVKLMGDCGAFDYVNEYEPPYTIDELIEFYERGRFDCGISLDHIVFPYAPSAESLDKLSHEEISESERRIGITLTNAKEFYEKSKEASFTAYGVAHGYDVHSFIRSVNELEKIGYRHITIGGMIKSKTPDLLALLKVLGKSKHQDTQFHLLGICRFENIDAYMKSGVTSADSTSPLIQGLKGGKYYDMDDETHTISQSLAVRVRQYDHDNVQKHIEKYRDELQITIKEMLNQEIDIDLSNNSLSVYECVKRLEVDCINKLIRYDDTGTEFESTFKALQAYEKVTNPDYMQEKNEVTVNTKEDLKKVVKEIARTNNVELNLSYHSYLETSQISELAFNCLKSLEVHHSLIEIESCYIAFNELFKAVNPDVKGDDNFSAEEELNITVKIKHKEITINKQQTIKREMTKVREFLSNRTWKGCSCGICSGGIMNIIFRSNQSNRRRGIHNLAVVTNHKNKIIENISLFQSEGKN